MAGFVDVLLRGLMLVGGAAALGGVTFLLVVLRAPASPSSPALVTRSLRLVAWGGMTVALAQLVTGGVALASLLASLGPSATTSFAGTTFAAAVLVRVALGVVTAILARSLARAPGGRGTWWGALTLAALALVGSSASISHAMARLDPRAILLVLDAVHQLAAAVWVGGLLHMVVALRGAGAHAPALGRRFSSLAFVSMTTLVAAGLVLSIAYVPDPLALLETAYGVMVLTKVVLLTAILGIAAVNARIVRRATTPEGDVRLRHLVEVEVGLAVTVLFAAASLTSLPPATDVRADRATLSEVAARFTAMPPRLASPEIGELLRQTNPLGGGPEKRLQIEREWSEFNHHWAGIFVLAMGLAAIAHRAGLRPARHWPLLFIGLGLFLFVRNDPEVWPLGPIGFWASLAEPEILQHRTFMVLVMLFGAFEWAVRAGVLPRRPWAYVFPAICAVGGGLLLTHSHAVFDVKEAFLMEVTHAPIGVLGAFAGWARWLELRLPAAASVAGRVWPACITAVGALLLVYSEG